MGAKMNRYGTFLTLLDRFKNHIFYERERIKKPCIFLTDVKKHNFLICISNDRTKKSVGIALCFKFFSYNIPNYYTMIKEVI
jgi:hypothetical protein